MKRVSNAIRWIGFALLVAALVQELRKPAAERTWHGLVAGFVPYDFRPPTLDRARAVLWNPDDDRILVPTLFGVGWTVNVRALVEALPLG
jgi:hypothetical protein